MSRFAQIAAVVVASVLLVLACQGTPPAASDHSSYRADLDGLPALAADDVLHGLNRPVQVTHAAGYPDDLYVVEQGGRVVLAVRETDQWQVSGTFLDISGRVLAFGADQCWPEEQHLERGLLSIAFPPDHADSNLLYVTYTLDEACDSPMRGAVVLSEFRRSASSRADAASERVLMTIAKPLRPREPGQSFPYTNHNGGMLAFGPDGYLYVSIGEGGSGGGPAAQEMTSYYGKMLRIDPRDPDGDGPLAYSIPGDNPDAGRAGALQEIWAYGLRNPWRLSFDRLTGDLWIGDVGQFRYEEINWASADDVRMNAGRDMNFGWPSCEGAHRHTALRPGEAEPERCDLGTLPVYEYEHVDGRCSVTGGVVVREPAPASAQGIYLFADLCDSTIYALTSRGESTALAKLVSISSFGEDSSGHLYVADLLGGAIWALRFEEAE